MRKIELKNVVWKEAKYYVARCLNVEVSSFGRSKKQALANLDEALALYFEDTEISQITKVEKPEVFRLFVSYA